MTQMPISGEADFISNAVNQFVDRYKDGDLTVMNAAVIDEIARMTPMQKAAAFFYINSLTTSNSIDSVFSQISNEEQFNAAIQTTNRR